MQQEIERLKKEEEDLQFDAFDSNTAWEIGSILANRAKKENLPILIDISVCNRSLFRFSAVGAMLNNDNWIKRKHNTVYLMNMSTLRFARQSSANNKRLGKELPYSPVDYASCGGAFPIKVRGVGFIGSIAVSGLADTDDHQVIIDAIVEYLK